MSGDNGEVQLKFNDEITEQVNFVRDASGDRIIRTDGLSWIDNGFDVGQTLLIEGSGINNGTTYVIAGVQSSSGTDNVLVLIVANTLTATRVENAAVNWAAVSGDSEKFDVTRTDSGDWSNLSLSGTVTITGGANAGFYTLISKTNSVLTLDRFGGSVTIGVDTFTISDPVTKDFDGPVIALSPAK